MRISRLPWVLFVLALISVVPAVAFDDSMTVVIDKKTGQYHLPSCPSLG
jgi:hypothetical protein